MTTLPIACGNDSSEKSANQDTLKISKDERSFFSKGLPVRYVQLLYPKRLAVPVWDQVAFLIDQVWSGMEKYFYNFKLDQAGVGKKKAIPLSTSLLTPTDWLKLQCVT